MAADFPRPNPSLLPSAVGTIQYWTNPLTYSENFATAGGGTSQVKIYISGINVPDFVQYGMGFTSRISGSAPSLSRFLPLANPYYSTDAPQFLSGMVMTFGTNPQADFASNNWATYDYIEYESTFTTRNYDVFADSACPTLSDGTPNELFRYVSRIGRPGSRERKVPGFQLETTAGQSIAEPGFVQDQSTDWIYTWYQVPVSAYPGSSVASAIGTINLTAFDGFSYGQPVGTTFAPGTFLFRDLGRELEPYRGRDGGLYYDVVYHFSQRPAGWNNYIKPGGTTIGWRFKQPPTYSGPDIPPYQSTEFQNLFKPI